jgi:hypothetical protein
MKTSIYDKSAGLNRAVTVAKVHAKVHSIDPGREIPSADP